MPLVQDLSLNLFTSSPACYRCPPYVVGIMRNDQYIQIIDIFNIMLDHLLLMAEMLIQYHNMQYIITSRLSSKNLLYIDNDMDVIQNTFRESDTRTYSSVIICTRDIHLPNI